jgi:hypothetical protein
MPKDHKRFNKFVTHPSNNIIDVVRDKITSTSLRATMTALIECDNAISSSECWQQRLPILTTTRYAVEQQKRRAFATVIDVLQ